MVAEVVSEAAWVSDEEWVSGAASVVASAREAALAVEVVSVVLEAGSVAALAELALVLLGAGTSPTTFMPITMGLMGLLRTVPWLWTRDCDLNQQSPTSRSWFAT